MVEFPEGAELVPNPVNRVPGFSLREGYFLPGFLFQSVVIAGGYGTGRELVEFFLTQGPLGGLLALQAALSMPDRVARLVLVAATPRFVQGPDWAPAMARATLEQFGAALVRDPETTLDRFLGLQVRGSDQARTTLRRLRAGLRERPAPRAEALEQGLALLLHADLRSRLPDLQVPSLWLQGERDTLVPAALADVLAPRLPAAEFALMAGAGHAPFLSHGSDFAGRLRGFLQ